MTRGRVYVLTTLVVLAWSGLIAGASVGILSVFALQQLAPAPGGSLALCEVLTRAPQDIPD